MRRLLPLLLLAVACSSSTAPVVDNTPCALGFVKQVVNGSPTCVKAP